MILYVFSQIAGIFGHTNIVEWLISEHKGDLNASTKHLKEKTLNLAVARGHLSVVRHLVDRGAQIREYSSITNTSPLTYAAQFNRVEILQWLLDHRGDLNHCGNVFGSPVDSAFLQNNVKCVELLLKVSNIVYFHLIVNL